MKKCKKCGIVKSLDSFAKNRGSVRVYCKECEALRSREGCKKTRDYINSLKTECVVCGYNRNPSALEFHHPNDDKDSEVSKLSARPFSEALKVKIDLEVSKCLVYCANCHREEHFKIYNRY